MHADALWVTSPGHAEIRRETLPSPREGEVLVRTLASAVSRGTELLVFQGRVPASVAAEMRAPHQVGAFGGPVKYGYLNVGRVSEGPSEWIGERVFCLYPHQSAYVVPVSALSRVPAAVPTPRAVLAGTAETALNALWDSGCAPGEPVSVIGAGMVGATMARVLVQHGCDVELIDTNPARAELADRLGVAFALPEHATRERATTFHTSASSAGLQLSLEVLATEGQVIELSWHGSPVTVDLGGAFHSRRLAIRASQVSMIAPTRRADTSYADRLAAAFRVLEDEAFDAVLDPPVALSELPDRLTRWAAGEPSLCAVVTYEENNV